MGLSWRDAAAADATKEPTAECGIAIECLALGINPPATEAEAAISGPEGFVKTYSCELTDEYLFREGVLQIHKAPGAGPGKL
jgi:hypothetical protein